MLKRDSSLLSRFFAGAILCVLLAPPFALAQGTTPNTVASGSRLRTYAGTPEGLRDLMLDIVDATSAENPSREALIDSLILPSDSTWFADVFGPEQGATLATAYRDSLAVFKESMEGLFRSCARQRLRDIRVDRVDINDPVARPGIGGRIAAHMKHPAPLYSVSFRKDGKEVASSQNYVYANGGFRHVSDGVFAALPILPFTRMRVTESAALQRLVHRVEPSLPKEGVSPATNGRVVLTVLIDSDGSVKELSVKQGDPVLARLAMDAVSQWKFSPLGAPKGYPHLRVLWEAEIAIRFNGP